ncbi:uncharacterized protein LOC142169621 [Nicotiana tabacum]|uniref:Uncharacterized protein LOC142169621 n=1 Tax=Nicotiana tabacum TaxID=4097 RepID=A0AC58SRM4_TOBAC
MDQKLELCKFLTIKEVKGAIFALSGDSASGPDGFTRVFYQHCWDTVWEDIFKLLKEFYGGASLPKLVTHTNLVLLLKKPQVQTFSDIRLISLSNIINKEIVTDIRLRGKPANVVIKLDMAKVLSRSLNKLFGNKRFIGFGMPKWTDPLNHLAYADDTKKFASADPYSLGKVVEVLTMYEQIFGQLINKTKSSYYMHTKVARNLVDSVGAINGFQKDISGLTKEEGRSRHWTKWLNLCLPKVEGGLGFKSLFDVSKALFAKL